MKVKHYTLTVFLFTLFFFAHAIDEKEKKDFGFAVHNAEVQVTSHVDYYFYSRGKSGNPVDKPYEGYYPFTGFNFGVQYLLHPIHMVAVSAGINFHMQGSFRRVMQYFPKEYVYARYNGHLASLMIPVYLHLYKRMPHSTFEFAAGPDFYLPIFQRYGSTYHDVNGGVTKSSSGRDVFTVKQIPQEAMLGLSIFLGAQLRLCALTDLFIGPQIAFSNLVFFNSDLQKNRIDNGNFYDVYLGLKLGFRFHRKR